VSPSGAARAAIPTPAMDEPTRAWLLDASWPTTRRLALARLGLDAPDDGAPTVEEPWIDALIGEPAGGDARENEAALHPYHKWRGVHWRLVALAELECDPSEPGVARRIDDALDRVIAWVSSPSRIRASKAVDGRVRQCASMDGNAAWAATQLGRGDDPRVAAIVERLIGWQWPDGGWNCDKRPGCQHASFNESMLPLRALAAWADGSRGALAADARAAADRAAEFLLVHHVDRSHRTLELAHPALERLRWPPFWHYDRLQGLRALREAGRLGDPRTAEALASLAAARSADGRWHADGRYWRAPGTTGTGVESVAWAADGEARMLTIQALEVLRSGR
jgi:hypothetical protein